MARKIKEIYCSLYNQEKSFGRHLVCQIKNTKIWIAETQPNTNRLDFNKNLNSIQP